MAAAVRACGDHKRKPLPAAEVAAQARTHLVDERAGAAASLIQI